MIKLRLRQLRKENKISCKKLGEDIGLSSSVISHYETGISVPSIKSIVKLAEYFNVSVDYLIGKSEFKNHKEVVKKIKKMTAKQYINTLIDRDMVKR